MYDAIEDALKAWQRSKRHKCGSKSRRRKRGTRMVSERAERRVQNLLDSML